MKLLFDENLSDRIVDSVHGIFPGSAHVKTHGLIHTDDKAIWDFAAKHEFTIVSKDADFHQRSLLYGHPPKFVFLRVGNCSTLRIVELLRSNFQVLNAFASEPSSSILVLK